MLIMDQDVLTNGALGALWKRDQARRLNKACSGSLTGASLLASPGFLVNCLSPKHNEDVSFPQLQLQSSNKRKADWSSPQRSPVSPRGKRIKYSLKEMADQFTASQIELAARSVMLPRAPHQKKLPGISESINVFMREDPEKAVASASLSATPEAKEELSEIDMSWAEPTPLREPASGSGSSVIDSDTVVSALRCQAYGDEKIPEPTPLNPERVKTQFLPASPVQEEEEDPSLLHRTVALFPTNYDLVKGALDLNPGEVSRKAPLPKDDADACATSSSPDSCGYPLNIALEHGASLEVLQVLADAAPEVIIRRDGRDECGSLALALRRQISQKNFLQVLHMLIKANPMCLRMTDRHRNTPLHTALSSGEANLELIRVLCMLYPPALLQTNLDGETPLQVAQRSPNLCQDNVLTFVQQAYNQELRRVSSSSA